jgi:hypothetical protein
VLTTSIGANVYSYVSVLIVDPRTTFASFFVIACAVAVGLAALARRLRRGAAVVLLGAALVVADVATLSATTGIPRPPLESALKVLETPR